MTGMIGKLPRTLTYGRLERIRLTLTSNGLIELLRQANEIPDGFTVVDRDILNEPIEIELVRETPDQAEGEQK